MPDNVTDAPKKSAIAGFGTTQIVDSTLNGNVKTDVDTGGHADDKTKNNIDVGKQNGQDNNTNGKPPELTEEQLKVFFESKGINYEGLDKLKEKANYTPTAEPTSEQKEAQTKAAEKRRLDLFISGGGTGEQYYAIKSIAEGDLAELSMGSLKKELKDAKFSDEQIDQIIKERYYQLSDEDFEAMEDEADKEIAKMKKEYGAKKLATRSSYIQKQAQDALANLNNAIQSEDSQAQNELTKAANIDAQFKEMSREDTYEIGKINGTAIPPVKSEVPEEDLAQVRDMLKDTAKVNNLFITKEGGLNYTEIGKIYAENAKLKAAVKTAFHESATRTNDFWSKKFGNRSPQEIGVGGAVDKNIHQKGKIASVGKQTMI